VNLFAYGTLMAADIMAEVTGLSGLDAEPAVLPDYHRLAVRGEDYPAMPRREA